MPEFKRNNRFDGGAKRPFNKSPGGGRSFGGPRSGGSRDFGAAKQMFDAECSSCHKMTQVPFRPNGMKPVYCSDCFKRDGDAPRERREFSPRSNGPSAPRTSAPDPRIDDIKREMKAMNETLERLVAAIEGKKRAADLTQEVQKHMKSEKPAPAKKAVKKVAKAKKKA